MRRRGAFVAILLVAQAAGMSTLRAAEGEAAVARLRPGQHAFWQGSATSYRVDVAPGGAVLRIGMDIKQCCGVGFRLVDPTGKQAAAASGYLSAEAYQERPAPGVWTVTVSSGSGNARFRARLETGRRVAPESATTLLPNLRLVPPYEFTFRSGLTSVPTAPGCNADDAAEYGGRRCLRFSLGPANTGPGPFQVRFAQLEGLVTKGKVYQRIYSGAGTFTERAAGEFEYHKTHQHYHHSGFGSLELLAVDPARRTMTVVGGGPKQGFCTADVVIFDWHRFDQDHQNSTESQCVSQMITPLGTYGPFGTLMGVSPGWADIYLWSQDGNYVDFADNPDGRYVVRSTADALGHVLESVETDNTSYAYLEIAGSRIKVLERGFGTGPFDPRKRLATDRVDLTVG